MKKTLVCLLIAVLSIAFATLINSCATLSHGPNQVITFKSRPGGAIVYVDDVERGTTPIPLTLPRNIGHKITITLEGYRDYTTVLQRNISGWVWGNLLLGGIPGLIIDAATGSMYKLTPEMIDVTLSATNAWNLNNDEFIIMVSLDPITEGEPIDRLIPE